MPLEVEAKFCVGDLPAVAGRVVALGGVAGEAVLQVDTYFAHPTRDYAQTDEALRLRRVGETNVVTYKGPKLDATTKTREEIELPLAAGASSFDAWRRLLGALGFAAVATVKKRRTPYRLAVGGRPVEVLLDEVDGLGGFVEIETLVGDGPSPAGELDGSPAASPDGEPGSELDAARQAVLQLAGELGLTRSERRAYVELLLLARGS
ncbi:MAG: class IV adenylate cyclase [Planctomycetota bacterium]